MIGKLMIMILSFVYLTISLGFLTVMNINALHDLHVVSSDNLKTIQVVVHKMNFISSGEQPE